VDTCDVLIVGGGPAGSACAWRLRQSGLDVVVIDAADFPRDKVCAGWITPQVIDELRIDPREYSQGRTFQPITGFRVGIIGREGALEVSYERNVSFGIRRCEFDNYLLRRSGARLVLGTPASSIERDGGRWIVNGTLAAPMLVGAAGHFCPVSRMLNGTSAGAPLVVAQEAEFPIGHADSAFRIDSRRPELYFCRDLEGYGWCFRKGEYLNVGIGRRDSKALPRATAEFLKFLGASGRIPPDASWRWRGHAYLLSGSPRRRAIDDGVLLAGDASGLAYPQSGEGIRPAIESGLLAASIIAAARGRYSRERLEPYAKAVSQRFGLPPLATALSRALPAGFGARLARGWLASPWFVRRVVLDRWFLHAHAGPLVLA
jgi:geranylgeranyl reductase family protein